MRIWHKDLIPVLPQKQLLGQWRELCCIARNIAVNGTPNHLLVNKVMTFHPDHFLKYAMYVNHEMDKRGIHVDLDKFTKWFDQFQDHDPAIPFYKDLFAGWHNDRYLKQCYYNLEEKHDCGGISDDEWKVIEEWMKTKDKHM